MNSNVFVERDTNQNGEKLQVISEKFLNSVIDDVRQISRNRVIIIEIIS